MANPFKVITSDIFDPRSMLVDRSRFIDAVKGQLEKSFEKLVLSGVLSEQRLTRAYDKFSNDMQRVKSWIDQTEVLSDEDISKKVSPDNFRYAAHICYWLEREKPIIDMGIDESRAATHNGMPLQQAFFDEYRLLYSYPDAYFAFDVAFHFVAAYKAIQSPDETTKPYVSWEYLENICRFLSSPSSNPEAIFLILKSLFAKP